MAEKGSVISCRLYIRRKCRWNGFKRKGCVEYGLHIGRSSVEDELIYEEERRQFSQALAMLEPEEYFLITELFFAEKKVSYNPKAFSGDVHCLTIRKAKDWEYICVRQRLRRLARFMVKLQIPELIYNAGHHMSLVMAG